MKNCFFNFHVKIYAYENKNVSSKTISPPTCGQAGGALLPSGARVRDHTRAKNFEAHPIRLMGKV